MKISKLLFYPVIFLLCLDSTEAQDIHFSQFQSAPSVLNPAQTGVFDGAYRFVGNGRRQWRSVTLPYQTFGGSIDAKNVLRMKGAGAGISVYNDKTGDSRYNTFVSNLALSYTFKLNNDSTFFVTLGAQSGVTQTSINYDDLRFDNQYNGVAFDESLPSNESFMRAGRLNLNMNAGIVFTYKLKKRNAISGGFSLTNINKANQSFYSTTIPLDQRFNLHAGSVVMLSEKVDLLPAFLLMSQGKFKQFTMGTSVRFILQNKENSYRALYFGGWSRIVDAAVVSTGMDYNNLYVGLSYDINYSTLTPASNGRGAIELSLIYIIRDLLPKRKKYKICPTFI